MSFMGQIEGQELEWYAVRMARPQNHGRRTAVFGAEYEVKTGRGGIKRRVAIKGTGQRKSVHVQILRRAGFEVFQPVKKVWRVVNHRTKEKRLVEVPGAGDWLFVGWPAGADRWADLLATGMVIGVAGTGGRWLRIPSARIAKLMQEWGVAQLSAENRRFLRSAPEFGKGDEVFVSEGPFHGFSAKVVDVQGAAAKILLDLFGRETELEIQVTELKKAGDW